jgi:hypothetical protein
VALTEKMAAPTHTRKPEQAATQSYSRAQAPPVADANLSIRLWTSSGGAGLTTSNWESENPAVCLTLDLIAASEGAVVVRQGGDLVAAFPSLPSAVQAARRLQWAFQGFSEEENAQAASLAILIYSPDDVPSQTAGGNVVHLPEQIEQAAPGQILLTEKASQPFEKLPGYALQAASADGLRELLWRGPESQSNRSFDEEILTQLLEQQGSQTPPSELPDDPKTVLIATAGTGNTFGTANQDKRPSPPVRGKSRLLVGGLLLAAMVLVAATVLYLFRDKLNPAPVQTQAQSQTPAAAQSPIASLPAAQGNPSSPADSANPVNPTSTETPAPAKAAKNSQKGAIKPIKPSETLATETRQTPLPPKAAEPAPRGKCDLEPSQYSGQIDQAARNLARGKYADAERQFSAVLACDPGNGRAKEGLERARMAARESE